MLFNSFAFVAFFIVVYLAYLALHRHVRIQNALLLIASYFFYGWWDWRFLSLIVISTLVDFFVGLRLAGTDAPRTRTRLVLLSLMTNLGILAFFKYFNFFQENAIVALESLGLHASPVTLNIILPLGISFYTFQTLSYTIDVYRGSLAPCRRLPEFALFVSFFPQLVAGPIERAANLLPQVENPRRIRLDQINAGIFLIIWGLTKKVVIADNAGRIADQVFNSYGSYEGVDLLIGAFAFTLQIYGDFSGYSDMARGLSKLMGFDLMLNFRLPYFATSPSDFWRRWHISLSSWLRDYLYISLGGNRLGRARTYVNLFLTMLLGGLWHGARWNFVIWGAFHGLALITFHALDRNKGPWKPLVYGLRVVGMFSITIFGWILFRCETVEQIAWFITHMGAATSGETFGMFARVAFLGTPLAMMQFWQHRAGDLLVPTKMRVWYQVVFYLGLLMAISLLGVRESAEFIYFQF